VDRIGRYKIIKELGRGAMGVVYQAVDPTIGRTLAIKTIRLREVDDPAQRDRLKERLFREARSAGVLSHPNIVTIYDMEEDDGVAYIAMQFVNGPTLDEVMSRPKAMGPQELFRILRQTASALDFAHEKGIVHRDIKPANIMIDEHGTAKIADFGIAKVGTSGNLTLSGTILGTPNYMSPEQVQGKPVDGRADQFSLAVVAYEILTGERPFGGEHLGTVVYRIVAEEPAVVHRLNPSLSPEIDSVIRKGLAKKADGRYRSCIDFINALEGACLQAEGWQSLARGTSHSIPTEAVPLARTREPKTERAGRKLPSERTRAPQRKTSMFFPALGAFVVVLGVLALLAWQSGLWQPSAGDEAAKDDGANQATAQTDKPKPEEKTVQKPADVSPAGNTDAQTEPKTEAKIDDVETPPPPDPQNQTSPVVTHPAVDTPPAASPAPAVVRKPVKPSPEVKASSRPPAQAASGAVPAMRGEPQDVVIQTNPAGVRAVLDNRPDMWCDTPCSLLASPGKHFIALTLAGYEKELARFTVTDSRIDLPLVSLRPEGGTLLISSVPKGANIFVDTQLMGSVTPAQILLPAGTHSIRVELNQMKKTISVKIANGSTAHETIILQP
jgi:serine/threonine-protein kinase